jgi:regulatory subunit for Cdc7p protein kinase
MCVEFKRVILGYTMNSPSRTVNPQHLSAALKLEKRHGRTLETDPSVARDEYVYFQGPFILISDIAGVHKPIMVKEFPPNSGREQALWPFIWATKEGSCPFVRPKQNIAPNVEKKEIVQIMSRKIPRPVVEVERKRVTLKEIGHVTNRVPAGMAMGMGITDQPASGIVNSSNQYSAIRSATTGSNITSVTGGVNGTLTLGTSRPVRDLKTRSVAVATRMEPPPAKKRKTETSLREQVVKAKKEKKEGYCENCKEKFDDYGEHTESRRHRKYARNAKNFVELDRLLEQLRRPLLTDRD